MKLIIYLGIFILFYSQSTLALEHIDIRGYFSFEFEQLLSDEDVDLGENGLDLADPNGSFDLDGIDLLFNAQITDRVKVAADLSWEHGTQTSKEYGGHTLEFGFIEYRYADNYYFRAGKMLIPFGIYNEIHRFKPTYLSVKEPKGTTDPDNILGDDIPFDYFTPWQTGLSFFAYKNLSKRVRVDFDLLIGNGEQENENPYSKDSNSHKSLTVRTRAFYHEKHSLGLSYFSDRVADKADEGDDDKFYRQETFGAHLITEVYGFVIWSEFIRSRKKILNNRSAIQYGYFLELSRYIENYQLTPFIRYDFADLNISHGKDEAYSITTGLNKRFEKVMTFKIEHTFVEGRSQLSELNKIGDRNWHTLKAALVVEF